MTTKSAIIAKLTGAFEPSVLDVIDDSERHRGHAGARAEGGTHFRVRIGAESLADLSRVEQHRAVMDALRTEFADEGLHALSVEIVPPGAPESDPGADAKP